MFLLPYVLLNFKLNFFSFFIFFIFFILITLGFVMEWFQNALNWSQDALQANFTQNCNLSFKNLNKKSFLQADLLIDTTTQTINKLFFSDPGLDHNEKLWYDYYDYLTRLRETYYAVQNSIFEEYYNEK